MNARRTTDPAIPPPTPMCEGLHFDIYILIYNLFAAYLNMNCFYVSKDARSVWKPLFFGGLRGHHPSHFEWFFGKIRERIRFTQAFKRITGFSPKAYRDKTENK